MTTGLRYFAYGSNLLPERLRERVPSARQMGSGYVNGRTLRFHKLEGDGSGKYDCPATGDPNERLRGTVYEMDEATLRGIPAIPTVPDPDGDRASRHWRLITDYISVSVNETSLLRTTGTANRGSARRSKGIPPRFPCHKFDNPPHNDLRREPLNDR